ncbi:Two component diguanylate cyclase [Sulfitobacter noctilucicola]|uniref:CheY-like chemotaxis protein n=1 Tax=Sulfitobacter noctilucicola TaxID=1342301 RepID=A0A7W6Q4K1_9RHOB|nr:response regulator [Sulfitobacter noctilucicola]KIN63748.1 Two component diguanylate cyclase [Sulfitobacter noctilucicola]MBB4174743.1 CheY-like chemotaxis protein [Sulfitobacter noctilucicola]
MRILAVDDDPIILELLTQFVSIIGEHELMTAQSGPEALDLVHAPDTGTFDCFLFDIQMPHMDGIQLTGAIRETTRYADTPILMLTAMSDRRYIDAAFTAGATDYVTKPFEIPELKARLALVEGLVQARKSRTRKIFATQGLSAGQHSEDVAHTIGLHEPISVYDVDKVIDYTAMQNYVAQLARGALFGSSTFAFTIRKIEEHHAAMSAFEFASLISDVSEVISDTLAEYEFLMAYAGNGTFVCVTESGWRPNMSNLMDAVNLSLSRTELYDNAGQQLYVRVSAGEAVRLIWKSESSVMEAVGVAHASAEAASVRHERAMNDLWITEHRA